MKNKLLLTLTFLALSMNALFAQDFREALRETFETFDSSQDIQQKQALSNKLSLIAKKFNTEWSAPYYTAYSKIILSYMEPDAGKKDAYLDEADNLIVEAESLLDKESDDLYVLKAMCANARIAIQPQDRWKKYGKIFESNLETAKKLNADNPRIYYLKGTSVFYTPKAFGGGKGRAKEYFERAQPLFAAESKEDITRPYWGYQANAYFLAECNKED